MSENFEKHKLRLKALYAEMYSALCLQGKVMGFSENMTRDAIQDLFADLLEKQELFESIKNTKSYLSVSLRRSVSKALRKEFLDLEISDEQVQKSYENFLIESQTKAELSQKLSKGIEALTPKQRLIIKLRFYDGLSYEEIAEQEKLTIRTVYNHFHSAIKVLRENNLKK